MPSTAQKRFSKMALIALMGFASGLPYFLTGSTLQAWMKEENVDLSVIGLFALVGLPYTLKFLWAPLMDRFVLFQKLGRRRSWMLVSQIGLTCSIAALSLIKPSEQTLALAALALVVTFFSASQDVVLDAWRRESLADEELGLGSSVFVTAYLISMRLVSGAGALVLAALMPWNQVYLIMALISAVGILATLIAREPQIDRPPPRSLRESVVEPFKDFFRKQGAWIILAFILLYKVGDNMASNMTMPYYLELGFTKPQVAGITKIVGWIAIAVGGLIGGGAILRLGLNRSLWIFGVLQALSTAAFALLKDSGHSLSLLAGVIAFENLTAGMGTSAFVAFMARLTNKRFTATQYALLTSLMAVPGKIIAAPTGYIATQTGWFWFFIICALAAIPGLLLIPTIQRLETKASG